MPTSHGKPTFLQELLLREDEPIHVHVSHRRSWAHPLEEAEAPKQDEQGQGRGAGRVARWKEALQSERVTWALFFAGPCYMPVMVQLLQVSECIYTTQFGRTHSALRAVPTVACWSTAHV